MRSFTNRCIKMSFWQTNQSSRICEALYTKCEDRVDQLQVLRLPTMAKFNAGLVQCNQSFERECIGPSKANYKQCMVKMMGKSWSLFIKEYNQRLLNWLVVFSLVMVVVGRFIIKFILIEMAAWILFIFLETYTRMFRSAESLYCNPVWHFVVATWETLVYSPILDLDRWAIPIGCIVALWMFYWRCYEGNMDRGVFYLCTMVIRVVQIDQYLINGEASVPFGILLINHLGRTFPFFNR